MFGMNKVAVTDIRTRAPAARHDPSAALRLPQSPVDDHPTPEAEGGETMFYVEIIERRHERVLVFRDGDWFKFIVALFFFFCTKREARELEESGDDV